MKITVALRMIPMNVTQPLQPSPRFIKLRIASTPRFYDKQAAEWKDGDTLFLTVNVWRQAAENVAESMTRGTRAIVQGRLRQRSYETKEGEKRTVYELEVDEIGPSLRYATAKVQKMSRSSGGGGGFGSSGGGQGGGGGGYANDDPWATATPAPTGGGSRGNSPRCSNIGTGCCPAGSHRGVP